MTTKDVIETSIKAFGTFISFLNKDITLVDSEGEKKEAYKYKSIVEGRKVTFEEARSHLIKIRALEEKEGIWDKDTHIKRVMRLINVSEKIFEQIKMIAEEDIYVDDEDDEKVKPIVEGKGLAQDLMIQIIDTKNDLKFQVDEGKIGEGKKMDFATRMVKAKK